MTGELDPFDFALALAMHRTVGELNDTMSSREYLAWKALAVYRSAMQDFKGTPDG